MKKIIKYGIIYVLFCLFVSLAVFSFIFQKESQEKESCENWIRVEKVPVFEGTEDNYTLDINGKNISVEFSKTGERVIRYKICNNEDIFTKR